MKKILFGLCIIFSCVNVYAWALDDLAAEIRQEQTNKEQQAKKAKERVKQKQQEKVDIADCEQAVKKARSREKELSPNTYIFDKDVYVFPTVSTGYGHANKTKSHHVSDFASDGVFIDNQSKFIYTHDTDYANYEEFRGNGFLYKKVGNYKYTTIMGATKSVPAYEATNYKVSELDLRTYLNNKTLHCCEEKGEIGISNTSYDCKTKHHQSEPASILFF